MFAILTYDFAVLTIELAACILQLPGNVWQISQLTEVCDVRES
jgi:hypothetical protein